MASTMPISCFRVVCRLLVQNASAVYFSVALFLLQCIFADEAHLLFRKRMVRLEGTFLTLVTVLHGVHQLQDTVSDLHQRHTSKM
jgi:flagellar biosynthesis regulator FlbT